MHCLSGHDDTVASILTQATDPQVSTAISLSAVFLLARAFHEQIDHGLALKGSLALAALQSVSMLRCRPARSFLLSPACMGSCCNVSAYVLQVITGSHDKTVRLWDIRSIKAKTMATLTYHKKSVRSFSSPKQGSA